ncbi:Tim44 domain-containing protein [Pokkaliibacter sp. CJK22405]|uniref:Tim44 domain-containing protein n=1 Tax=Pokkaliibacter sp. CJK22405 TaxID=3384615 RepID=UPI00398478A3
MSLTRMIPLSRISTFVMGFLLVFTLGMQQAEAKRLGGGKSFGSTYSTPAKPTYSPTQSKTTTNSSAATNSTSQTAAAANTGRKGGLMGGMLGGLLAGSLLGALFFGGGFSGGGLIDILLLAGVGYLIYRMFAKKRQAAQSQTQSQQASNYGYQPQPAQGSYNEQAQAAVEPQSMARQQSEDVIRGGSFGTPQQGLMAELAEDSMKTPEWFNAEAFLEEAKGHFRALQQAWDQADYATMADYMTPALFEQIRNEREALDQSQHTEVVSVMTELVNFQQLQDRFIASIQFSGWVQEEQAGQEGEFSEIWHLTKSSADPKAPWQIEGIQQPD